MAEVSLSESFVNKLKVRVFLKTPDDRLTLCGEPKQTGEDGREFFVIPAHQGKYIRDTILHYEVGEEFVEEKKPTPIEELDKSIEKKGKGKQPFMME